MPKPSPVGPNWFTFYFWVDLMAIIVRCCHCDIGSFLLPPRVLSSAFTTLSLHIYGLLHHYCMFLYEQFSDKIRPAPHHSRNLTAFLRLDCLLLHVHKITWKYNAIILTEFWMVKYRLLMVILLFHSLLSCLKSGHPTVERCFCIVITLILLA